jgi:hypothetical protein
MSLKRTEQEYLRHTEAHINLVALPMIFSLAISKFQENQEGLKLNLTHEFLVYADDVN